MRQLQLVLYFAACHLIQASIRPYFNPLSLATVTGDDCKDPIGDWCKMTSEWVPNRPVGRSALLAATYRRSHNASEPGLTRILIYGGLSLHGESMTDSWIYCPRKNSWTPVAPPKPTRLISSAAGVNSFVTLCSVQVILLGQDSNATWLFHLFDGTREAWVPLSIPLPHPSTRTKYSVSAAPTDKSPCRCKNSVFLYGGYGLGYRSLDDLWELRCVDDDAMRYRWINIKRHIWSLWPPGLSNHLSSSTDSDMYIFRGDTNSGPSHNVWRYHLETAKWTLYDVVTFSNFSYTYSGVFIKYLGVVMFMDRTTAIFYDVARKKYITSRIDYSGSELKWKDSSNDFVGSVAVVDRSVYLIGSSSDCEYLSTWEMNQVKNVKVVADATSKVLFDGAASPLLSPGPIVLNHVFLSNFLFYYDVDFAEYHYWRLDLKANMWTLYDHERLPDLYTAAVSALGNDTIVAFAKDKLSINEVWIYTASLRLWNKVQQEEMRPPSREYSTLTAMQNGSLILYGNDFNSAELWILTVNFSAMTAAWYQPRQHGNQIILGNLQTGPHLSKSYAAVLDDVFYVYGGTLRNDSSCSINMFSVNTIISSAPWNQWQYRIDLSGGECVWRSATIGRYVFYIKRNSKDLRIADLLVPFDVDPDFQYKHWPEGEYLTAYENKLVTSVVYKNPDGTSSWSLYSLQKGCPPGSYSKDFSRYPCLPCQQGTYSDKPGALRCEECSKKLVTVANRSMPIENCVCHHGNCVFVSDCTTVCACNPGFTGTNCEYPTLFLIGTGIVAMILVIIAVAYCANSIRKHENVASSKEEQLQETRLVLDRAEQTLTTLSNIWSVDNVEIVFLNVIGYGSFGDVWSAAYRDQIVAVKVLKIKADDCTDEQLQDFNDESELLRSIFHANIVQFIGTGMNVEGKPFIVLEYMERGSVRNELDAHYAHRPMERYLQVKYSLGAAKGMRHLHAIGRMHRDLKCDNLLISNHGIVKVADLGCTKLVPKIEEGRNARGTRAVGTSFFRAPEIIRGRDYDSSVDVYSYGITLWEIQTANHPYSDHLQMGLTVRDILDRVVGKDLRPEFPTCCDKDMIELTKSCWQLSPFRRPTFDEIVLKLEAICFRDRIGKN